MLPTVAASIVGACLDYCNSLAVRYLRGSQRNLTRIQRVQNSLARVFTKAPRRFNATECGSSCTDAYPPACQLQAWDNYV